VNNLNLVRQALLDALYAHAAKGTNSE